jgi:hypothetical protein
MNCKYGNPWSLTAANMESSKTLKSIFVFFGCEMTMLSAGQTVQVSPKDTVVIDSGVMSVTAGD